LIPLTDREFICQAGCDFNPATAKVIDAPKPLMRKPKFKWNFETILGVTILAILGFYYVILFFLFLLVKYL
jgi:hypothetical protein